jgi:hypothetical protein
VPFSSASPETCWNIALADRQGACGTREPLRRDVRFWRNADMAPLILSGHTAFERQTCSPCHYVVLLQL